MGAEQATAQLAGRAWDRLFEMPGDVGFAKGVEGTLYGAASRVSWKDFIPGYGTYQSWKDLKSCRAQE